jgi:tetratricopeptide (TPR) repeat protein
LEHEPGDVAILGNRCATALMLKRFDIAKADAKAILEHDKENVRARSRLSKACLGSGDVAGALEWAQQAATLEPGAASLLQDLKKLQQLQQQLQEGQKQLAAGNGPAAAHAARRAQALAQGVLFMDAEVLLAQALLLQGNAAEALTVSRGAVSADSSSSSAMTVHAEALVATGNVARATALYANMMRSDPDNSTIAKAYKCVKAMEGGKDKGNAAFKRGAYQEAYDECAPRHCACQAVFAT